MPYITYFKRKKSFLIRGTVSIIGHKNQFAVKMAYIIGD
jgi:hypothetical protein